MLLQDKLGVNSTTSDQLNKQALHILPKPEYFLGVYAADEAIDQLPLSDQECLIMNTDDSNHPGVHWCALYALNGVTYFFDSFGRKPSTLSPYWKGKGWVQILDDPEYRVQSFKISDCGVESLAFIKTFNHFCIVKEYPPLSLQDVL